jgi:uncharacterized protein (DUF1499 family)
MQRVQRPHTERPITLKNPMRTTGIARKIYQCTTWAVAAVLSACSAPTPMASTPETPVPAAPDLACSLSSNCVNSLGTGGFVPLTYSATPAQALATLQATLATFPEATITRSEPLALQVIFTTRIGFKDQVDFKIDPQQPRIDFRSRSLLGLYDWGKNRSRMQEFVARFEKQSGR